MDELYKGGPWGKNLNKVRGSLKYGISSASYKERQSSSLNVDKLSQKRLLRHFLCEGDQSACVLQRTCECLTKCRYGQRYLETLADTTKQADDDSC